MIKKSIRIYSIPEIKKMSVIGITDDFQDYINNSQDNIKEYLSDNSYGGKIQLFISDLRNKPENIEVEPVLDDPENKTIIQQNNIDKQSSSTISYENLDFDKRIDVTEFVVHLCKENYCKKHHEEFEIIQVLINYDVGRKYGIMTKCCKKCKKLFMTKAEVNEWKPYLKNKNIEMTILKEN